MPIQKKTIKVLMFLLPAIVTLLGYTAFHEMLFREPPCLINCNQQSLFSDNEKFKKWLAFLESLREDPFNNKQDIQRPTPTPLDIAFLQDKINLARSDNDLTRYKQIISDLTSASGTNIADENGSPEDSAPLVYLADENNPNAQVFAGVPESDISAKPNALSGPNGPIYLAPGANGAPLITGGGNGGGNTGGDNSNPISIVPVPKSIYLAVCAMLLIGLIRFKFVQRNNILNF
ncbi:MAG: hypothetical protein Q8R74_09030 [Methylophilus sp.]|nr:hypothetical protein [Methylophilus sp.]MDP3609202.1 hypothetical protein [Methylophilus sp.]